MHVIQERRPGRERASRRGAARTTATAVRLRALYCIHPLTIRPAATESSWCWADTQPHECSEQTSVLMSRVEQSAADPVDVPQPSAVHA